MILNRLANTDRSSSFPGPLVVAAVPELFAPAVLALPLLQRQLGSFLDVT